VIGPVSLGLAQRVCPAALLLSGKVSGLRRRERAWMGSRQLWCAVICWGREVWVRLKRTKRDWEAKRELVRGERRGCVTLARCWAELGRGSKIGCTSLIIDSNLEVLAHDDSCMKAPRGVDGAVTSSLVCF
jgi:hypothetical protein